MTDKLPLKNGENYTLDDCREHARTHRAYGWSRRPWGHWTDEQKKAYDEAFYAEDKKQ